jgi:hypothetical protein
MTVSVDGENDDSLVLNYEDMALIGNSLDRYADEYENYAIINRDPAFSTLAVRARTVAALFRASFGSPTIETLARAIAGRDKEGE